MICHDCGILQGHRYLFEEHEDNYNIIIDRRTDTGHYNCLKNSTLCDISTLNNTNTQPYTQ